MAQPTIHQGLFKWQINSHRTPQTCISKYITNLLIRYGDISIIFYLHPAYCVAHHYDYTLHCSWCLGDAMSQGISSHGNDLVLQKCVSLSGRVDNGINVSSGSLIARFMGPTLGPSGADRTRVGRMLAPWTLLSGIPMKLGPVTRRIDCVSN